MIHRFALAFIIALSFLVLPAPARAGCFSCANGVNASEWANRCPASQTLWNDMTACICPACPSCAAWCADPGVIQDATCTACEQAACYPQIEACSADTTGCLTCSAFLSSPGTPADMTEDHLCGASTQAEIDLSACACAGACAQKCGGACVNWGGGYYSLHAWAATPACMACVSDAKKGCASSAAGNVYAACAAN